jgi:predicted nucleic acid-binding Zn ribbon protein
LRLSVLAVKKMKRNNQQTIGEAISEMLRVFGLQQKLDETKLIASWEKVMGKTIAKHTTRLYISKKKLFIHLNSSAARQTLSYDKDKIITLMNEEVGKQVIEEVVLL